MVNGNSDCPRMWDLAQLPELKREYLLFFGNLCSVIAGLEGTLREGARLHCYIYQSFLSGSLFKAKLSGVWRPGCLGICLTNWLETRYNFAYPSLILKGCEKLQLCRDSEWPLQKEWVEITGHDPYCLWSTNTNISAKAAESQRWGMEQREPSSLGRLKSCWALGIETLGAAMSSSLWPYYTCGGHGLRWQDAFLKWFELLETLLLDQVQLLGLSMQHEI